MPTNNMTAGSGPVTPENDDARWQAGTGTDKTNDDTEIVDDLDAERNAFASLSAKLALAGFSLHQLAHGGYLVSRWDRTFHTSDLAGVRSYIDRQPKGAAA